MCYRPKRPALLPPLLRPVSRPRFRTMQYCVKPASKPLRGRSSDKDCVVRLMRLVDNAATSSMRAATHWFLSIFRRTLHSHSIVNRQALLIGKNRALLAGNRPDTDIATVAQQCMTTVALMTLSDEDRFWPRG